MTTELTRWLDELDAAREKAWDEVAGLCSGSRRWTMRVPADPRDSDELISTALAGHKRLTAAVRAVLDLADEWEHTALTAGASRIIRAAVTDAAGGGQP